MSAPLPPQALKRTVADFITTEKELADLHALLQRGLNTWEDAPKWLLDLSDQLEAGGLITSEATSQDPDWRELTRRLFVELRNCDQVMLAAKDDGEPVFIQEASVRDVLRDAQAALKTPPTNQKNADTVSRDEYNALLMQEHALSSAYVRLRHILGAMDPPNASDPKALWAYVEEVAQQKVAASSDPVLFVSPGQLAGAINGTLPGFTNLNEVSGGYLPVRTKPGGKFTMPLFARPMPGGLGGWKLRVSDSDGRKWLHIETPGGAKAALSTAATVDGGRRPTIAAQVLAAFAEAQEKHS